MGLRVVAAALRAEVPFGAAVLVGGLAAGVARDPVAAVGAFAVAGLGHAPGGEAVAFAGAGGEVRAGAAFRAGTAPRLLLAAAAAAVAPVDGAEVRFEARAVDVAALDAVVGAAAGVICPLRSNSAGWRCVERGGGGGTNSVSVEGGPGLGVRGTGGNRPGCTTRGLGLPAVSACRAASRSCRPIGSAATGPGAAATAGTARVPTTSPAIT